MLVNRLNYVGESNIDVEFPNHRGTALVWRKDLPVAGPPRVVELRRLQVLTLGQEEGSGSTLTLINVYAATGTAGRQEREDMVSGPLTRTLRGLRGESKYLVLGDWNSVTKERDVERDYVKKHSPSTARLEEDLNLTDAYRHYFPLTPAFTFYRPSVSRSRLDRGYVSPGLTPHLLAASHEPSLGDHAVLRVLLDPAAVPEKREEGGSAPFTRAENLWILNNSILDEVEFSVLITELWVNLRQEQAGFEDIVDWWEELARPTVREFCQLYSKRAARARRGRKDWTYLQLRDALEEGRWPRVAELREELRVQLLHEEQGLKLRSRCKQEVEEERASIYHVGREISNASKGSLSKLKVEKVNARGEIVEQTIEDEKEIEDALVNFYDALFNGRLDTNMKDTGRQNQTRPDLYQEEFLHGLDKLSEMSKKRLEVSLAEEEVRENLMAMQCGRSPGEDGLTREFYTSVWDLLGQDMVRVLQGTLNRERLPLSNTRGLTRPTSKVQPPAVPRVTETRPITRLNVDYKLLSRCLASRAKTVLPEVGKSRQMALPGCDIMEGGHNVLSAIQYIEQKQRGQGLRLHQVRLRGLGDEPHELWCQI